MTPYATAIRFSRTDDQLHLVHNLRTGCGALAGGDNVQGPLDHSRLCAGCFAPTRIDEVRTDLAFDDGINYVDDKLFAIQRARAAEATVAVPA